MTDPHANRPHRAARRKFLELSLESTRKSYYPQLKKQLENAEKNQKRLQLLIDNVPAQISYVNAKEEYVFVNRAFEKIFAREQERIIGRQMETVLGPIIYADVKYHIDRALSGRSGRFELAYTSDDNSKRWYEINYVPEIDPKGTARGFYVLTIDLTEKKMAEQEQLKLKDRLRRTQKMEAIGTLAGGIAHDFNNILSGIFGYSQLIDSHINDAEKVTAYNEKIFKAAQRAASLIQQILSFTRQTQYVKHPIQLKTIIKEALNLIRSTIPSNIEIRTGLGSTATIMADPTQIHQLIMNLCTNAYHAMEDDGGILTVALKQVQISEKEAEKETRLLYRKYLMLSVSDTGPGIADHIKERIFDPYFTTKKIDRGTGLGLSVVAGIVKHHHGFIEFETEPGAGTMFQVYFPVIADGTGPKNELKIPENDQFAGTEHILLVDDETAVLETLAALLSARGYQVSSFADGDSAIQAFAGHPDRFDLIITDMTMPKMTGDKLAAAAMEIRKDIPVIICTGYHERFSEQDALRAGIRKYLEKPLTGWALAKNIRELMDEES